MPETVIETFQLTKRYGYITAVNRLNLKVYEGEIFGFLGPNGAGKTTTLLMLMGLTVPTSGTAKVGGYDIIRESREIRRIAGLLPEGAGYYEDLTARQNLDYIGQLNDIPRLERRKRIDELLEVVGLKRWADVKVEKFSRGMKQRLGIAGVLIKKPKIAFFDEPTIGLDPQGTKEIRDLFIRLNREEGLTIFLSSHLLYEVQQTCHRVGIIRDGRLVVADTIENLSKRVFGGGRVVMEFELTDVNPELIKNIEAIDGVSFVKQEDHKLYVHMEKDKAREVSETITRSGSIILLMRPKEYGLEDIFLRFYRRD